MAKQLQWPADGDQRGYQRTAGEVRQERQGNFKDDIGVVSGPVQDY